MVAWWGLKSEYMWDKRVRIFVVVAVGSGGADSKEMSGNILRFGFLWENVK